MSTSGENGGVGTGGPGAWGKGDGENRELGVEGVRMVRHVVAAVKPADWSGGGEGADGWRDMAA